MIHVIHLFSLIFLAHIVRSIATSQYVLGERLLLYITVLIPLGKLVPFHIPQLVGLKFAFILCCVQVAAWCLLYRHERLPRRLWLLSGVMLPAIFSLALLPDPQWLVLYRIGGQTDSILFRFFSMMVLILFATQIAWHCAKNPKFIAAIANVFLQGLVYATCVGFFIFCGFYWHAISIDDVMKLSADTHLIGNIYRFNPGANVNEFGVLLGYGFFLLPLTPWKPKVKWAITLLFFIAEFLTLTRAAWLAVLVALLYFSLSQRQYIRTTLVTLLVVTLLGSVAWVYSEDFRFLLSSRTEMNIGASGEERLEKFEAVYDGLEDGIPQLLFGHGWATNLYVHSVPLQLVYEIGLVGFSAWYIFLFGMIIAFVRADKNTEGVPLLSCFCVLLISSLMHHTLYHLQTWLIIGLILGKTIYLPARDERSTA